MTEGRFTLPSPRTVLEWIAVAACAVIAAVIVSVAIAFAVAVWRGVL